MAATCSIHCARLRRTSQAPVMSAAVASRLRVTSSRVRAHSSAATGLAAQDEPHELKRADCDDGPRNQHHQYSLKPALWPSPAAAVEGVAGLGPEEASGGETHRNVSEEHSRRK